MRRWRKCSGLQGTQEGLDLGMGEGSNGGISTLDGQEPRGEGSMRIDLDHQEAERIKSVASLGLE